VSTTESAWAVVTWPFVQFWSFLTNLWRWLTQRLQLRDIVLPAFYDSAVWLTTSSRSHSAAVNRAR